MKTHALPGLSRPTAQREPDDEPGQAVLPTYAIGIVNFHTYADLERCLRSVKSQTWPAQSVMVIDNDPELDELEAIRQRHPEVCWEQRGNVGFSAAANRILALLGESDCKADFFLLLNPDVELEPDFSEKLLRETMCFDRVALASGKLLRPEIGRIDSAGITMPRHRRPRDRGSEETDHGQYDETEFVFAASGAALMIRAAAIEDLTIDGELFDEDFFTYHEDTDLAWRANLLGWRVLYVPSAQAVHARHWRRKSRFDIPVPIRRHSFKNHYLQMIKNEQLPDFLSNLPAIAFWETLRLGYALFRDPDMLGGYRDALRHSGGAWRKRRVIRERARARGGPAALPAVRAIPRPKDSAPVPIVNQRDRYPSRSPV